MDTAVFVLLAQTAAISLTGVLAPGPITAVCIGGGARSPHTGALVALGHALVEIPLIALIALGLGQFVDEPGVRVAIFALGGVALVLLGKDMLGSAARPLAPVGGGNARPLVAGMLLSAGNAYFLIWWATVGAALITRATEAGVLVLGLFMLVHWSCDLGWCWFLSFTAHHGGRVYGDRFRRIVFAVCGVCLIVFGVLFLKDAVLGVWG